MVKDSNNTHMPANRIPLADRIKKLTETIRIHVRKPHGEEKDALEIHEVVDGGTVIGRVVKQDGKVLEHHASSDSQQSGQDEKVHKATGVKEGDVTSTTPMESAKDVQGAEQVKPGEKQKERETREAEGQEKIKAPDSKEKKTKEPKEAKKPDTSMSKMASGESAETQGAAPLEKNYNIKRVGDTLHYSRLGEDKVPATVPPTATQTPKAPGSASKAPATGPNKPQGTAQSPQMPAAPQQAGAAPSVAAPTAKQAPSQRWKVLFEERKKARREAISEARGRKGLLFAKSEKEEFENTPGNRKRAKDEYEQDMKAQAKEANERGDPLEKDVVQFKKPAKPSTDNQSVQVNEKGQTVPLGTKQYHEGHKPKTETPKPSGAQGMFDVLGRGKQMKPGSRDQKIKAALKQQAAAGSPYAETRSEQGSGGTQGAKPPVSTGTRDTTKVERPQPKATEPSKPILIRDMNRMKAHTQSGRPFRVMLASHEDHATLPGYHLGLDKNHSINQIKRHLSNPISPISKAVHAAIERGHDKLIVHNPDQPFKAVK